MSIGTKNLLIDAFSWVFLTIAAAFAIMHFEDIRAFTSAYLDLPNHSEQFEDKATLKHQRNTESSQPQSYGQVKIRRGRGGHYSTVAKINNQRINVLVDTGATLVALTYEDARRAGIYLSRSDFTARSRTANGIARSAPVTIRSIRIGDITLRNIRASVSEPGALHVTLLGMSFLGRLARVEMRQGDLILQK